jgi:hypothetical protein
MYLANGGGTTFTVPEGWAVPTLGGLDFSLAPVGAAPDDTVRVFYDMRIASKDADCPERQEPGSGATAADIVGDIAANPGVDASTPESITIGGLEGHMVELTLAEGWTAICPIEPDVPSVALIVDTIPSEGPFWGIRAGLRQRLMVLDRPTLNNVVLLIESADGPAFDALVEAAMPVLQTDVQLRVARAPSEARPPSITPEGDLRCARPSSARSASWRQPPSSSVAPARVRPRRRPWLPRHPPGSGRRRHRARPRRRPRRPHRRRSP